MLPKARLCGVGCRVFCRLTRAKIALLDDSELFGFPALVARGQLLLQDGVKVVNVFLQSVQMTRLQNDHQDGEAEEKHRQQDEAFLVTQNQGSKHLRMGLRINAGVLETLFSTLITLPSLVGSTHLQQIHSLS